MSACEKIEAVIALGGGAARGLAHIGILDVLEQNGVVIKGIAGTSIGAVVGGLRAAHKLQAFEYFIRELDAAGMLKLLDPVVPRAGLFAGNRIARKLEEFIPDIEIEDLDIPFCAVSTDITTGEEVLHTSGPIMPPIRASMAIPGVFAPVEVDGRWLVDGGVCSPVPVSAARKLCPGYPVIAVNLFNTALPFEGELAEIDKESKSELNRLERLLLKMRQSNSRGRPGLFASLSDTITHMEERICRFQIAEENPELLIEPAVFGIGLFDFHRGEQVIAAGTRCANAVVESGMLRSMAKGSR
ncbi:MAG: patatin-like phospholipase family protein [Planctomycetota bacterium]|jgi:NTE family protein|nr:patatin-like phospholipase family protein [Planctomycetota bacterium]